MASVVKTDAGERTRVAGNSRGDETGNLLRRQASDDGAQPLDCWRPARTQHEGNVVPVYTGGGS